MNYREQSSRRNTWAFNFLKKGEHYGRNNCIQKVDLEEGR